MKLLTKALSTLLLFALALTTLLACGDGDTGKSVSSEEVINQSIAKIEDMMDIESGTDITSWQNTGIGSKSGINL